MRAGRLRSWPVTAPPTSRHASRGRSRTSSVERPGGLIGMDCFSVGQLRGPGGGLAADGDRHRLLVRLGGPRRLQTGQTHDRATSKPRRRVAHEQARGRPAARGRALQRRQEFKSDRLAGTGSLRLQKPNGQHPHRAPADQGHVEARHKTIIVECWRPAFARYRQPRLRACRDLDNYLLQQLRTRPHRQTDPRRFPQHHLRCAQMDARRRAARHISGCPRSVARQAMIDDALRTARKLIDRVTAAGPVERCQGRSKTHPAVPVENAPPSGVEAG
jgi:hypothetical protein